MRTLLIALLPICVAAGIARGADLTCADAISGAVTDITKAKTSAGSGADARSAVATAAANAIGDVKRLSACVNEAANANAAAIKTAQTPGITKQASRLIESHRNDEQAGASSTANGSSSPVTSASTPSVFGLALEQGAVTQTSSGTSATMTVNPYRLAHSFTTESLNDPENDFLRRLSIKATMNTSTSQSSTRSGGGSGSPQMLLSSSPKRCPM